MVTTVKRLKSPTARKGLSVPADKKSRVEPYFVPHSQGVSIGYRPGTEPGTAGSWLLREFQVGKPRGRYVKRTLGTADDLVPADGASVLSWDDVQRIAGGDQRPTVTKPGRLTVAQAAEGYFATRQGAADQDRLTYKAFIEAERDGIPDLGERSVSELTTGDLKNGLPYRFRRPATRTNVALRRLPLTVGGTSCVRSSTVRTGKIPLEFQVMAPGVASARSRTPTDHAPAPYRRLKLGGY